MGRVNPYAFLVGCPRSGTTLVQRLVDAHPQIAVINETLWIPGYFERREGLTPEGRVTPALVPKLLEHRRFERMGIEGAELEALVASDGGMTYADFVSVLFDRYARAHGKSLAGDKSPGYVRNIRTLHELWPTARFVHLIRDGRDVALSFMSWSKAERIARSWPTWQEDKLTTTALWWERNVRLGREAGTALGSSLYYEVRYEDLVEDPARECRALCIFLGVPYDEAMLRFHEGRTRHELGVTAKRAWLPPTPGLREWRVQMPIEDAERFEATAGELLDELSYARVRPHLSASAREGAARIRSTFTDEALARGRALPGRWQA